MSTPMHDPFISVRWISSKSPARNGDIQLSEVLVNKNPRLANLKEMLAGLIDDGGLIQYIVP